MLIRPRPRARQAGFSLLEILIVITIMGILTAVVAPRVSQYIEDSKVTAAQQELANLKNALLSVKNKSRPASFPRSLKAVSKYLDNARFSPSGELLDPFNNPYRYTTFPSGGMERQRMEIVSAGPDGIFGSNSEAGNRSDDIVIAEGTVARAGQGQEEDNSYEEEFQ